MMERVICLVMGYCFGLFQSGYIYSKFHGKDIRKYGSGNSGTTNVLRVMGKKAGAVVLVGDVLKSILACMAARLLFQSSVPEMFPLLELYAGSGVILGHNFPFYMNFKGGKGIAATGGLVIALGDWRLLVIALGVFLITVIVTRYVSLGSVLGLITVFVTWTVLCATGGIHAEPYTAECCVIVFLLAALGIWQHRSNIARLLHGTENKLWGSQKIRQS